MTLIYFIVALAVLILIHEFGHFIVAKWVGIRVDAFSFGFGPRLVGIKIGETDYRISLLPFGGYVKMLGEDPEDKDADDPRSFAAKGIFTRLKVVAAGPIMNLMLCAVIMPCVFMMGRSEPVYLHNSPVVLNIKPHSPAEKAGIMRGDRIVAINGSSVSVWGDIMDEVLINPNREMDLSIDRNGSTIKKRVKVGELPDIKGGYLGVEPVFFLNADAKVGGVEHGSPAYNAGIKAGDRIISFAGKSISNFYDLSASVNEHGGKPTDIIVNRAGKRLKFRISPAFSAEKSRWLIGISSSVRNAGPIAVYKYDFHDAVVMGMKEVKRLTVLTLNVIERLVTFKLSFKVIGGPIIIAKASAQAAASGFASFLYFMAFLSLQLSIFNVLPIPVLDGGHILFFGIEAIRRRPLSIKIRSMANQVGFILLISLMILVTLKDINNVFDITSWISKFFAK